MSSTSRTRPIVHALLGLLAALTVAAATPTPASAHTGLVESTPAGGAGLDKPPARVVLRFAEKVDTRYVSLTLTAADAAPVQLTPKVDGATVTAAPPAGAVWSGTWTVAYRVVSADGHPVTGTVSFAVAPRAVAAADPTPPDAVPTATPTRAASPSPASTASPAAPPVTDVHAAGVWWKWPAVILVVLTVIGAPAAAAYRGIGAAPADDPGPEEPEPAGDEPDQSDQPAAVPDGIDGAHPEEGRAPSRPAVDGS